MAIPNLKDNTENLNFKLENFISMDEGPQFLELPGIQDIVFAIEEIFGALGKLALDVMNIVKAILNMFNIGSLFDSIGLKNLFNSIFNIISSKMQGLGFSASSREKLRKSYVSSCLNFNQSLANEFGFVLPDIMNLSLIGVLMAMLCTGIPEAGTGMYNLFANKNIMQEDDLKNLFGKTVGTMVTMETPNSLNMLHDNGSSPYKNNIFLNNTKYALNAINYLNTDTTSGRDNSSIFNSVTNSISSVDNALENVSNISIFSKADRFKELAQISNLSKVNRSVIDNPTSTTPDMSLSVLSLF